MNKIIPKKIQMAPIIYTQFYLFLTFLLFLTSNLLERVENIFYLVIFIIFSYSFLYLGYCFGLSTNKIKYYSACINVGIKYKNAKYLIIIGSVYFTVWGINQVIDFWSGDFSQIFNSLFDPGSSYKSKFAVYENRLATGEVNRVTQGLILTSLIYGIFIPVLVVYWKNINSKIKACALSSVVIYIISFMSIGTQKGLGDVFLFTMTGVSILLGSGMTVINKVMKKKIILFIICFFIISFAYMAINQSSRASAFDMKTNYLIGDFSKSVLADTFGEQVAYGVYTILSYPSHGYLGLSYNLQQDFEPSFGAGLSPAVESYRHQYLGGDNNFNLTYPARTEKVTGWPAGMYWATAFPWFASDLTFVGCIFFMFLIGFVFSRVWINCIANHDLLSFAALGQLFVLIAFLPANNQVLMQRQGLWVVVSIVFLRFAHVLKPRKI